MTGERVAGTLRGWLGGSAGQTVVYGLLALLAVIAVWAFWHRRRRNDLDQCETGAGQPKILPPGAGFR